MKIAVFSTHALFTPHYETELEIMLDHILKNDKVFHVVCNQHFEICDLIILENYNNNVSDLNTRKDICQRCISKRKNGRLLIKSKKIKELNLINNKIKYKKPLTKFANFDDLRKYQIENYDIGESVVSSMIGLLRNPEFNLLEHEDTVERYLNSCSDLFYSTIDLIEKYKFDKIYIFNGRVAHARAILRACQFKTVKFLIHDRGNNSNYYELYDDLPHSLNLFPQNIERYWNLENDENKKNEIANTFYDERIQGKEQSWVSFVKDQTFDKLPSDWDKNKKNIVIYTSSEDEFAAVGKEWENPLYKNQSEGILSIINDDKINLNKDIHIYIRIHPNLKGVNNSSTKPLFLINKNNVTVIPPESDISTYNLMFNADKILTFGSTVGIEAVYWGKPSILAGISFYKALGNIYIPNSHEELITMIITKLEPTDKVSAIKYGYYLKTFGVKYKYYKPESLFNGKFLGKYLEEDLTINIKKKKFFLLIIKKIYYLLYKILKKVFPNLKIIKSLNLFFNKKFNKNV